MAEIARLRPPMQHGAVRLDPLGEARREPLRAACARDDAIWQMYLVSFVGEHFDRSFDLSLGDPARVMFAVLVDGALVGMTGFINIVAAHRMLEIGSTYLTPAARGTGINAAMKDMMIRRAFAAGFNRAEFRVDTRNTRSQAAMAKLGATREGVMRRHLVTWTGHVRDSAIYSLLPGEWPRPK